MAYVVTRPRGRFEIRESVHTDKGPRARSLASFTELSDEVLARALEARPRRGASRRDPGDALIDLLGLVAQVSAFGPRRAREPLRFPPLARLRAARAAAAAQ